MLYLESHEMYKEFISPTDIALSHLTSNTDTTAKDG